MPYAPYWRVECVYCIRYTAYMYLHFTASIVLSWYPVCVRLVFSVFVRCALFLCMLPCIFVRRVLYVFVRHAKCVFESYVHSVFVRQAVCDVLYVFVRVLWISPRPLPLWYQAGATHWQWGNDDAPANRHHSSTRLSKDKPNARRSQLSISRCTPDILFEENCDHKLWWSRPRTIPPKKISSIVIQDPTIKETETENPAHWVDLIVGVIA